MSCEQTLLYMEALIDDELSVELTAEVMEHLRNCGPCQFEWDTHEDLRSRIRKFRDDIQLPGGLMERIRNRVDADTGTAVLPMRRWAFGLTAAATVLGIGIVLWPNLERAMSSSFLAADIVEFYEPRLAGRASASARPETRAQLMEFKPVVLTGWNLVKLEPLKLGSAQTPAMLLTYAGRIKGRPVSLIVCQMPRGRFNAGGLNEHLIQGRRICCGQVADVSIAYYTSKDHDNIFMSNALSVPDMLRLAAST